MKKKNLALLTMAAAVAVPAMVVLMTNAEAVTVANAKKADFLDVPKSHTYYDIIMKMRDSGYITGYPDGYFRPNQTITRQHAAAMVTRAVTLPKTVAFSQFNDVPKTHMYANEINALQQAGIFKADNKGKFYPEKLITRAEMAKILAIAFGLEAKVDYSFKDVKDDNEFAPYIKALYSKGVITGYRDGTFKPTEALSRQHYAVMLYRAKNVDKNYVAPPITKEPTTPLEAQMNEFMDSIKNDPVYALEDVQAAKPLERTFSNERFYKLITDGRDVVADADFKFTRIGGNISIVDANNEKAITVYISNEHLNFNIHNFNEDAVNVVRQFMKMTYPEVDVDEIIVQRANEAREIYNAADEKPGYDRKPHPTFSGNSRIEKINGLELKIGTNAFMEFFWIEIK